MHSTTGRLKILNTERGLTGLRESDPWDRHYWGLHPRLCDTAALIAASLNTFTVCDTAELIQVAASCQETWIILGIIRFPFSAVLLYLALCVVECVVLWQQHCKLMTCIQIHDLASLYSWVARGEICFLNGLLEALFWGQCIVDSGAQPAVLEPKRDFMERSTKFSDQDIHMTLQ